MPDREKVIKGLHQHCEGSMFDRCGECPYYEYSSEPFQCRDLLLLDALELLKEQEAVVPIPPTDESDLWKCGNCNHQLFRCTHQRYCEMCGKAVKWE